MRLLRSKDEKQAASDASARFDEFVSVLGTGTPQQVNAAADSLESSGVLAAVSPRERRKAAERAYRAYVDAALADEVLTQDEEEAFGKVTDAVGFDDEALQEDRETLFRLVIAKANNGRLDEIDEPHVMTKKGEVVHLETMAGLMKETVQREFRGGSSGFSFRVTKGVRYRTGAFRGHSVVVGTTLEVADSGPLAVTSTRVVFLGNRKTVEIPYTKLVGMEVFTDGIRLSASNRQNAPLFRVENGNVVAATVNAAVQRLNA